MKYSQINIQEAFDIRRKNVGEIPFKKSDINDPYIKELIYHASEKMGVSAIEIAKKIKDSVDKIEGFKKYSTILYETMARNAVETAAFDLIEHSKKLDKVQYDQTTFNKLMRMVEHEHDSFFPLRAPGENNYIFHIDPIIVPNSRWPQYTNIGTAAATESGHFIFNQPFMQKLLDWASIEELKPKGKKYVSNGGTIPNEYGYIEFLIMHELLHYAYGDFQSSNRLKQYTNREHNWASDFRSNYMLVKNGYSQLPIGLFSDLINYDRQGSYSQIVKVVHDELAKLPKPEKEQFEDMATLDDHEPPSDDPTKDDKPDKSGPSQDEIQKDIEGKMSKRQEVSDAPKPGGDGDGDGDGSGGRGGRGRGHSGMDKLGSIKDEIDKIKPKMNWKALIRKMMSSSVIIKDVSYAKPSRRSIIGASIAAQTGAAAMKPGDRNVEQQFNKLVLVFDTSGSMGGVISTVLAEAQALLKKMGRMSVPIGIVFFAGELKWFQINIGKNTYTELTSANELGNTDKKAMPGYKTVLQLSSSGGTAFSSSLAGDLSGLASKGYNIMIFSDDDIIDDTDNWSNFSKLWVKHKSNVFFIADSVITWKNICNKLQQIPDTFSHL